VQLAAGVNVPEDAGTCVRAIVPVGVTAVPNDVSVTVMMQLVGVLGAADDGAQTIVVEVDLLVAVNVVWPELDPWFWSPG
jgi:hypothetical protein